MTAAGQGRFQVSNFIWIIKAEMASDSELDQFHTEDWRRSGREPGGQKPDQFLQDKLQMKRERKQIKSNKGKKKALRE